MRGPAYYSETRILEVNVMPERKPVIPPGAAPNPVLSPGVIVGDFLFVSGHVAVDNSGNVVGEGDA